MRIPDYKKFANEQYIKAMKLAAEEIERSFKKAKEKSNVPNDFREWFNKYGDPYGRFNTGGYVNGSDIDYVSMDNDHIPVYHKIYKFKSNLTTPQKIKAFRFVYNAENAALIDYTK